ncbi:FAD-binding domain-containing protein [Lentinula lateritia]|uniref:FAD-binding domain-containing protein n=1 Tax=Lentinula aff. lateritia TaxID=2804960 RepID=A0ACC1U416_9AGAR|nr:FAD-binding domain-containing protein [Lentinula aff. lateritia]KAJ3856832.1 FAD-binding domain-containing protein [Lentinula lateritia]
MVTASGFVLATALWYSVVSAAEVQNCSSVAAIATQTCQQLEKSLGSTIVQTKSSGSEYAIGANFAWSTFSDEVNFQPSCIVFPNTTQHVQTAMKAIFENKADYAVQAGGHSGMIGWNTVQNGVLISFMNMNSTSYDSESDTITLLPGIHWGDATSALQPYGVAPVGGRIATVGTGLLLGGGISYLSPAEGYAADNYVSLDVVLVNGTLVTATADNEYADLFKALKGGGNRFGIYPNSSSEALLAALAHFIHDTTDPNAVLATTFRTTWENSSQDIELDVVLVYNGTEASFNTSFAEFLSIPYTSSALQALSYLDLLNAVTFPDGLGTLFGASALTGVPASTLADQYLETYRLYNNFSTAFASSTDIAFTLLDFSPVPKSQIQAGYEKGTNPIVPPLGTGGYFEILFQVTYAEGITEPSPDVEQGRQFWISTAPSTPGLPFFLNEADANQQILATYGGYEFLKQVYAKYDPTRFNVQHTQGPLGL